MKKLLTIRDTVYSKNATENKQICRAICADDAISVFAPPYKASQICLQHLVVDKFVLFN